MVSALISSILIACALQQSAPNASISFPRLALDPSRSTSERMEAEDPPARPTSGYDGGFLIRSEDGANELVIEGLFQVLLGVYSPLCENGAVGNTECRLPSRSGRTNGRTSTTGCRIAI
jgi:hypothetical protein